MKLNILGCYAATPRTITNPTAQVLELKNEMFLIDCGEGTQVQLRKHKIKFSRINHIFISHLHGDHFFGLVGLISTFSLLNRLNDLHVYGPKGIKEIILLQLKLSNSYTGYGLYFHELENTESELVYESDKVTVHTIPLDHRVYTNGYLFKEKNTIRKPNILALEELEIDKCYYQKVKKGGDITLENGTIVPNEALSFPPDKERSYAFCSDTAYKDSILPIIKNVDLLYHETTILESESHLTAITKHCTAKEAATIAQMAEVGTLVLGHYSTRYGDINCFKREAQNVFKNVQLADDGKSFDFK